jgi:hypothetical protein
MEPNLPADLLPQLRTGLNLGERGAGDGELQMSESPTPTTALMQVVKG